MMKWHKISTKPDIPVNETSSLLVTTKYGMVSQMFVFEDELGDVHWNSSIFDGVPSTEHEMDLGDGYLIAWMYMPEPYKEVEVE